jgi:beta-glucosidase
MNAAFNRCFFVKHHFLFRLHGSASSHGYVGYIEGNERLGIPALKMNDGPQGFRDDANIGTTTSFPAGLTVGATWDINLSEQWGSAMGAGNVSVCFAS